MDLFTAKKILGLDPNKNYSAEEVKKAYRTCTKKYHPDLAQDDKDRLAREEKMKEINNAYDVLSGAKGYSYAGSTSRTNSQSTSSSRNTSTNLNDIEKYKNEVLEKLRKNYIILKEDMTSYWNSLKSDIMKVSQGCKDTFRIYVDSVSASYESYVRPISFRRTKETINRVVRFFQTDAEMDGKRAILCLTNYCIKQVGKLEFYSGTEEFLSEIEKIIRIKEFKIAIQRLDNLMSQIEIENKRRTTFIKNKLDEVEHNFSNYAGYNEIKGNLFIERGRMLDYIKVKIAGDKNSFIDRMAFENLVETTAKVYADSILEKINSYFGKKQASQSESVRVPFVASTPSSRVINTEGDLGRNYDYTDYKYYNTSDKIIKEKNINKKYIKNIKG